MPLSKGDGREKYNEYHFVGWKYIAQTGTDTAANTKRNNMWVYVDYNVYFNLV